MRNACKFLLSLACCTPLVLNAAIYYVSPTGNDALSGTTQANAWKTIDKVNTVYTSFQPGDQILFQRGGVFRGTLLVWASGSSANQIIIGAYGTGNDPVISGSNVVTGWTVHSGNIWKAPVSQNVKYVYIGGQRQTLARYPNSGWLRSDNGTSTTLQDAALTQPSGYWNNAMLVVRSTNWSYDTPAISNHSGTTLTFPTIFHNLGSYDWGYFLCNKLSELDQAGEWFYDPGSAQLYLWAPGNANPNSLSVEASVRDRGIDVYWSRQYVKIQNLAFRHQRVAGIWLDGTSNITVYDCDFVDLYHGIRTVCTGCTYDLNTITGTYATGAMMIDNNATFKNNVLTNIAMVAGLGESNWGYMGLRTIGSGNVIRNNRLINIGYLGMEIDQNALVEKNYIKNPTAILNDGGGIAFDLANGMVIQDNILVDGIGDLESSAPDFYNYIKIVHGIYFGDTQIQNTTVQRNTVSNFQGAGVYVDHTMVSTGNQIKDNVLFNNLYQMLVSDFSNNVGTGALAPFHMPNYNDVYSGNLLYSIKESQTCMKQYNVYSANGVDFGTYTNNKYYHPYDELSIYVHNTFSANHTKWTLERWQVEKGEDAGSSRSPQRLSPYAVTSVLTPNMVANGTFDVNATGWNYWPSNATCTRDLTYLDNGGMKAYIPNASVHYEHTVRNPNPFAISSGQWYRMAFSLQSNSFGTAKAALKGVSQFTGATSVYERTWPYDTQRREVEMIFQSNLTDNAVVQYVHQYTEPQFWVDNVVLERVAVTPIDPLTVHTILYNDQASDQALPLPGGCWQEVGGTVQSGNVTVQPWKSKVFYKVAGTCGGGTGGTVAARVFLAGPYNWGLHTHINELKIQNLIPNAEPYSALGYVLENAGATISATANAYTGNLSLCDWVLLELRNTDAGYTSAGRRAALVTKDGTVIGTDGNTLITFTGTTAGKYLVIRHRNHQGVMTAAPIPSNGALIDFTLNSTALYGSWPTMTDGTYRALWPGNVVHNSVVSYTGSLNDRDPVLSVVGGIVPTAVLQGYRREDVNMDGWTKYTGAGNDRDFILQTVGGTVPTSTRVEQLP